jgi:hypothetical protein
LNCRLKLIDLDVAAGAEKIAVFDDLVDHLIFVIELLIKLLNSKHFHRLLQVSECVKIISIIVELNCKFLVFLGLIYLLLLVKGDLRAEQAIPIVFSHLRG